MEAPISEFLQSVLDNEEAREYLYKQLISGGNQDNKSESSCTIFDVSNLAKFCQKIAKQEDCPPGFIDIVNKEFWKLI